GIYAPFAGGYESTLLKIGFADNESYVPSEQVKNYIVLAFYLFDIITAAANVILLPFVDVEKKLPTINAELLRRKKEAVLARGETWIEPEEENNKYLAKKAEADKKQAEKEAKKKAKADAKAAKKAKKDDKSE
ncbi:MAG: hypothetical protein M0Q94_15960, partial [Candidatus Cloacimonetes bacterium]|nr:hypothetical protein [Candidatus Cloacimonadota bacterium]